MKGHFKLSKKNDSTVFALYTISNSLEQEPSFFDVTISYLSGIGTFSNDDEVLLTFARTGDKGDTGYQGSQGLQGVVGTTGNQGSQGYQGVVGTTGNQGSQGNQGYQGVVGTTGNQGYQGVVGTTGSQGSQGFQGVVGTTGNQGSQGNQGYQGYQGYQGVTGPVAGTANQVVYKNITNDAAGSSNFTFDGTNAVLAGSLSSSAIIGADIDGGAF